ncbi:ferrous iron transport protein B [Sporobacter termitidis DSM 10068]|uniref:Ferrous iron transport protein B n=1 Tax=Sporobacter termitidis DSM 10068 TaxID=1123282 RepID=A0A1M5XIE1_9FIRM|nr:ferrous iron transport protein B [Sporobacter termitidis]SHH99294.1 ferrous iron transport protein B [Sporobacter termitidis DSM 10068]
MPIKIALAGNPNCGKTTMFNDLTGSSQYVGNWPGVTVEKKEGKLRGHKDVIITDLPGIYSLSPYTLEEVVSRNYLINERPDAIINIVDGTNLERNLYLTTQIAELGIPMVISLNMMDIVKKSGDKIDAQRLGEALGCAVVETAAIKGHGSMEAAEKAIELAKAAQGSTHQHKFDKRVEDALSKIEDCFKDVIEPGRARWYAAKLFERDSKVLEALQLPPERRDALEGIIVPVETTLDDDSESIITNERYEYIAQLIGSVLHKKPRAMSTSDRIDRIVTNRFLALPIFAAIIWLIYYVSVTTVGSIVTDWTNDTLFGTWITNGATAALNAVGAADWLTGLIVDGIIGGVGTVLGFVPQMLILFFFLSILEDSGYMARVAFIMDRLFRRFGLSGKSFIPILISSGCGVPGIMATRTIENEKDRKMTIMVTTFMPCGAKLVIIGMIVTTFFAHSMWIAPGMYFLGIAMIVISGIILKKTAMFGGDPAPFVMELPPYHLPSPKGVLIHMWERSRAFIVKAGTIIFIASGLIWFLSSFSWSMQMVESADDSMLAAIGHAIAWFFMPLGFGTWKGAVATISALAAKENAIGTLAVLSGVSDPENTQALMDGISSMFTQVGAFSFMLFNLFNPPCFAAIGATSREMGSLKWTMLAIGYQVALGYALAFIANQLGSVIFAGASFGVGAVIAILVIAAVIFLMVRPASRRKAAPRLPELAHKA